MTTETSNARGDLQAVLQEMRERQVARQFKSQTLIDWADRIERATAAPPPAAARWDVRGLVAKVARAHEFFAANSDLRMTTGDHAARAADLRIAEHALNESLAAEGVQARAVLDQETTNG